MLSQEISSKYPIKKKLQNLKIRWEFALKHQMENTTHQM